MVDSNSGASAATRIATRIELVEFHRPPLIDGDYRVEVVEEVAIAGQPPRPFTAVRRFVVQGPRYSLAPSEIQAVFPPEGSLGDHASTLPHILFARSTLPWERRADPDRADLPWLALLLFDDATRPAPQIVALGDLRPPSAAAPWWPGLVRETGEDDATQVTVIDVPRARLETVLPPAASLPYLAHVRRGTDDATPPRLVGDEWAAVIGSRLPAAGGSSTVHLVSLEQRYRKGRLDLPTAATADDTIRLISLKSWSFACIDDRQTFTQLLLATDAGIDRCLRAPPLGEPRADSQLERGAVPLPHTLRDGSRSVSWYQSPLAPCERPAAVGLPVRAADALLRYDPATGLFDVSHAAAWELGRLLTLQRKEVALALYAWKRARAQALRQAEQQLLHLPIGPRDRDLDQSDAAQIVERWFAGLRRLEGVPFNYLVPDARMLPVESLRLFRVDHGWIDCLLDGAFSIGRITRTDHDDDQRAHADADHPVHAAGAERAVTGCLLRSEVVSGWPGLGVTGLDADRQLLPLLRMDRLAPGILIALFDGELARLSLHQKPEGLHFGFDRPEGTHKVLFKRLRDPRQDYRQPDPMTDAMTLGTIPRHPQDPRVIDIDSLVTAIANATSEKVTSAQFAVQMIEGVEEVVFLRAGERPG